MIDTKSVDETAPRTALASDGGATMKPRGSGIADDVLEELMRARKAHPCGFHSAHEGFAVLLEEVEELKAEVFKRNAATMRAEALQVAAMALRFIEDVCDGGTVAQRKNDAAALRRLAQKAADGEDVAPIALTGIASRIDPT